MASDETETFFVYGKTGNPDPKHPNEPFIETWWMIKQGNYDEVEQ